MTTETFINEALWSSDVLPQEDWHHYVEGIDQHLRSQGWEIRRILLNGEPVDREQPPQWPGGDLRLDVEAAPEGFDITALQQALDSSIPAFVKEWTKLGDEFSRGHWRAALERLTPLLEEFKVALTGWQVLQALPGTSHQPGLEGIAGLLEQLSRGIESQSWVEVSDLLLYELVPLLEEWGSSPQPE